MINIPPTPEFAHYVQEQYGEEIRGASPDTWAAYIRAMALLCLNNVDSKHLFGIGGSILTDVAVGKPVGLATHLPEDFVPLAMALATNAHVPLHLGAIICPAYGGQPGQNGTFHYDMSTLTDQLPQTTTTLLKYLRTLSNRADNRQVHFTGLFAGWEMTRSDTICGLTQSEALVKLESSSHKVATELSSLTHANFTAEVVISKPSDFHSLAHKRQQTLLSHPSGQSTINGLKGIREQLYQRPLTQDEVALELAEAQLGYELLAQQVHILLVVTSNSIARACLSGGPVGWIQLAHNYRG